MAEIHPGASIVPSKLDLLAAWMPAQRWYTAKGHTPALRRVGGFRFEDPAGKVGMETLILVDEAASPGVVYQVPVTYREAPLPAGEAGFIGTMEHSVLGTRYVYDAPKDPAYVASLMRLVTRGGSSDPGYASIGRDTPAQGHPHPGAVPADRPLHASGSRVLSGEQSNTSIIVDAELDGVARPLIVKIFRVLHDGENPDVVLQSALASAGSTQVPAPVGAMTGEWDDPAHAGVVATGHLAFAQEFLPGTQDAWRVALDAVAADADFTTRAFDLGAATAAVHTALAQVLPTQEAGQAAREAQVCSWEQRARAAVAALPELAAHAASIDAIFARAARVTWPRLQRIHGDFHLGLVPTRRRGCRPARC